MFGKKKKKKKTFESKYAREHSVGKEIGQMMKGGGPGGMLLVGGPPGMKLGPKGKFMKGKRNIEAKVRKGDFPTLVTALFKGFGDMKVSAAGKLMAMTARDFDDREAWLAFYEENKDLEIRDWQMSGLIEAGYDLEGLKGAEMTRKLIDTLRSKYRHVREGGYAMLKDHVGPAVPFQPNGTDKAIINGYGKWLEWLEKR